VPIGRRAAERPVPLSGPDAEPFALRTEKNEQLDESRSGATEQWPNPSVEGVMMARTIMEKERVAAEIAERLAHQWEQPSWREAEPLHRVAEAFRRSVSADAELAEAVRAARADGCSWSARPGRSRGR